MSKTIVLHIGEGNLEDGLSVNFVIPSGAPVIIQGKFPGYPSLAQAHQTWQSVYNDFATNLRNCRKARVTVSELPTSDSQVDPGLAAQELRDALRNWSSQDAVELLRLQVREYVHNDPIHLRLQTENPELQKLPLHLWRLISDSRGTLTLTRPSADINLRPLSTPVKILAVLGSDEDIDTQTDLRILKQQPGVQVSEFSSSRSTRSTELSQRIRDTQSDILYFGGHSFAQQFSLGSSENNYRVFLDELESSLIDAIQNGLKLVILNSCDSLELANGLLRIGVPYVIAMRGCIPDPVAHRFLEKFAASFFQGNSLHLAMRYACRSLEDMQLEFPGVSWLPVLYQNSGAPLEFKVPRRRIPWAALLAASCLLGLIIGIWQITAIGLKAGSSREPSYSSRGEDLLFNASPQCNTSYSEKEAGVASFNKRNFQEAEKQFATFLSPKECPSDLEAQIYRNNAQVLENTSNSTNSNPFFKGLILVLPFLSNMFPFLSSKTLTVAIVVPGSNLDVTQELLRGLPQIQDKVNNELGGIYGKKLLLQIVNGYGTKGQFDEFETQKIAKEITQDPEIAAIVGPYTSAATVIFGEEASREKLTVIAPTSTVIKRSKERPKEDFYLGEFVLRTALSDAIAAKRILEDIRASGKSRLIIAYEEGGIYSKSFKEEVERIAESYNVKIAHICKFFNPNETSKDCLTQGNPDSLLWLPPAGDVSKALDIIRINARNGSKHLPVWGGDSAFGHSVLKQLGSDVDGMKVFISWHPAVNPNSIAGFPNDAGINFRTVMTDDALQAVVRGLAANPNNPHALRDTLLSPGFQVERFFGEGFIRFVTEENSDMGKKGVGVGDRYPDDTLGAIVEAKCFEDTYQKQPCTYVKP
jgi:branched-chain amino acid transport system substrate-binding protein